MKFEQLSYRHPNHTTDTLKIHTDEGEDDLTIKYRNGIPKIAKDQKLIMCDRSNVQVCLQNVNSFVLN